MWNPFARTSEPQEPEFPPLPATLDEVWSVLEPYMNDDRPLDFFFEAYIMDVIGALPAETKAALDAFVNEDADVFEGNDWRTYVRQELELSGTIDVAILDEWIRRSEDARCQGGECHPWRFAVDFIDEYLPDDSRIDVWTDDTLEEARERIDSYNNYGGWT